MTTTQAAAPRTTIGRIFLQKFRSAFLMLGVPLIVLIILPICAVLIRDWLF